MSAVVVITGGSRGIGLATSQQFLASGSRVAICASNPARLAATEKALTGAGKVLAATADVSDARQVQRFITQVTAKFNRVDVPINNAGRWCSGEFVKADIGQIDEVIDVNLKGLL